MDGPMEPEQFLALVSFGVNFIRRCMGLGILQSLPTGIPGSWSLCPIALSLSFESKYMVENRKYALFISPALEDQACEDINLVMSTTCQPGSGKDIGFSYFTAPPIFYEFVQRYDDEEFPELIRDGYRFIDS